MSLRKSFWQISLLTSLFERTTEFFYPKFLYPKALTKELKKEEYLKPEHKIDIATVINR